MYRDNENYKIITLMSIKAKKSSKTNVDTDKTN